MKKIIFPLVFLLAINWLKAQCVELSLQSGTTEVVAGESICIDVKASNFTGVSGLLVVLDIDSSLFEIASVTGPAALDITSDSYSLRADRFRLLVFDAGANEYPALADGETLFTICLRPRLNTIGEITSVSIVPDESDFTQNNLGCIPSTTDEDNIPVEILDALGVDYTTTDASCGENNGAFSMTIAGGTAPFTVSWAGIGFVQTGSENYTTAGGQQNIGTNLPAGQYAISIQSSDSPPYNRMDTISISNAGNFALSFDVVQPCSGASNGSLQARLLMDGIEVDLANPRYAITWNTGATGTMLNNLGVGTYTATLFDSFTGCELSESEQLQNASVRFNPNISHVSCRDETDLGSIFINPSNGSAPYVVNWAHSGETTFLVEDLTSGAYQVSVSDDNGCVSDTTINIIKPIPPTITGVDVQQPSCQNPGNGVIEVQLSGGTGEAGDFIWTNTGTNTVLSSNTSRVGGLSSGTYSWQVITTDNCQLQGSEEISVINMMSIDDIIVKDESCPSGQGTLAIDGGLEVKVSGGVAPYSYRWSDIPNATSSNNKREDLAAGAYQITVLDDTGCQLLSDSVRVGKPDAIDIQFSNMQSATCPQSSVDGQVTALVTGGTPGAQGYWFEWNSGETGIGNSHRAISLPPGLNSVTVTDVNFCQHESEVFIGAPDDLVAVLDDSILTETSCAEVSDGRISIFPQGGTAPYSVSWDHGEEGTELNNLPPGNYRYTLEDANGCKYSSSIQITSPEALEIRHEIASSTDVTCFGENDGAIEVTPIGGTPPFEYQWSTGVPTGVESTARPLAPGTYSLTLTDKNNCRATITDMIVQDKAPIRFDMPAPEPIVCAGGTTPISVQNIRGGNGNAFKLIVNDVISVNALNGSVPLTAGRYNITIQDEVFGCESDTVITIVEPRPVQVGLGQDIEIIIGDSVTLVPDVADEVDTITYLWQSSRADDFCMDCAEVTVSPQRKTTYSLLVVDANGCEAVDEITIDVDKKRRVSFPNIFAPSSFGKNTSFGPMIDLSTNAVLNFGYFRVFDRWGNMVHEATNIEPIAISSHYWDGTLNGRVLPSGVYIYLVEVTFADNQTFVYRGHVTMLR